MHQTGTPGANQTPSAANFSIEGASVTVQELAEMIKFIKHDEVPVV